MRRKNPRCLSWCIQRLLTFALDLFVVAIAILLAVIVTTIHSDWTGFLGVPLFNIVTFSTTLQQLITRWTQLETGICAVNRARPYVS
jgi:ATP-binding cassette subfamily C (CFTR/MRP) protein 1